MIVKYQLENRTTASNSESGLTAPECITDGGYFIDRDGTLIGYSDGTYPLGVTCVEITEAELESRKSRLASTKVFAIRSDGINTYAERNGDSPLVAKTALDKTTTHSYLEGDTTCDFYSERPEGRKRYWKGANIATDKYSQPDSDHQVLSYYSEIVGVTKEWYYEFDTFDNMMNFINSVKPISIKPALEATMRDDPLRVRPGAAMNNSNLNCVASLEITASGDKTTTIYVSTQPEYVLS